MGKKRKKGNSDITEKEEVRFEVINIDDKEAVGSASGKKISIRTDKKNAGVQDRKKNRIVWLIFFGFVIIYIIVLTVLGKKFLKYVDESLVKFEESQSVHAMETYFESFKKRIESGELPEGVDLSKYVTAYDTEQEIKDMYMSAIKGKKLSWKKSPSSYNTEAPEYLILAGDDEIASVKFEGYDSEVILGILTVMKWKVVKTEYAAFSPVEYEYTFTVPYGYTVYVDGMPLGDEYLTDEVREVELLKYAKEYSDVQDGRSYKIGGIKTEVAIAIKDFDGNFVEPVKEGNHYSVDYPHLDEVPQAYEEVALFMAQTWDNFMTRDLYGGYEGFDAVSTILINGSYYHNLAYDWAHGVDITFTSPHTLFDPVFTNVRTDNFVRYSNTCFSCHIYFEKQMLLTKTSQVATNVTDSEYVFVYYDDTEDGVDNPHWAIVYMKAATD